METTDLGDEPSGPSAARRAMRMPGDRIGDFIVERTLGAGAMGVVHAARHATTSRHVAIKVLHARGYTEQVMRERSRWLHQEADALARLSHPGIVEVIGVGEIDGVCFMVMELIEGVTLADWLASRPRSWSAIARVMRDVTAAMAAAHAAGLVHGDLKPDNIMVTCRGEARVMDFGLAEAMGSRRLEPEPEHEEITEELDPAATRRARSWPRGTPAYMAPERLSGERRDPATDQFSLCVTFYEALYGERPFRGRTPAELYFRATRPFLRVTPEHARVPAWLHAIVARGLAKHAGHRWPDLDGMKMAIEVGLARRRTRQWSWAGAAAAALVAGSVALPSIAAAPCEGPGAFTSGWTPTHTGRIEWSLLEAGFPAPDARRAALEVDRRVVRHRVAEAAICRPGVLRTDAQAHRHRRDCLQLDDTALDAATRRLLAGPRAPEDMVALGATEALDA